MSQISSSHTIHATARQLCTCRLVNNLTKKWNEVADFRVGFERVRHATPADLQRLAEKERGYVAAISRFYTSLPRALQMLYGKKGAGMRKTINILSTAVY